MNPKDMTKEELIKNHADARAFAENSNYDLARNCALKDSEDCAAELLRRLNEADALRKENEKLRKDKERIDFLDDGNYGIDPRNIPGVMMNGRRFHCLAGRGDWSSLRDAIDAARLAKESEAKK